MMTLQKPVDPVPAATMLLLRDEPEFQVLMVMRHHQIDFASGALVFPGGKPSAADEAPEWADYCRRSEEHTSELQSLMRISYAVFCLKKKTHEDSNMI